MALLACPYQVVLKKACFFCIRMQRWDIYKVFLFRFDVTTSYFKSPAFLHLRYGFSYLNKIEYCFVSLYKGGWLLHLDSKSNYIFGMKCIFVCCLSECIQYLTGLLCVVFRAKNWDHGCRIYKVQHHVSFIGCKCSGFTHAFSSCNNWFITFFV